MDSADIVESAGTIERSPISHKSILRPTGFIGRMKLKKSLIDKAKKDKRVTFTDSLISFPDNEPIMDGGIESPRETRSCACLIM